VRVVEGVDVPPRSEETCPSDYEAFTVCC